MSWCLSNYCNYQMTNRRCSCFFIFLVSVLVFSAYLLFVSFFGSYLKFPTWFPDFTPHISHFPPSWFSPQKGHSPHLSSIFLLGTSNLTEGFLLLLQQPTSRTWCASGSSSIPTSPWRSRRSSPGKRKMNSDLLLEIRKSVWKRLILATDQEYKKVKRNFEIYFFTNN